ncbi:MAG: GNAT family N-acetyltransferase [Alphaproteobacteria bacterium]
MASLSVPADSLTIRRLTADDTAAFRALRLEALTNHPEAFGESAAEWTARSDGEIAAIHDSSLVMGAFADRHLVALGALGFNDREQGRHLSTLWTMYVAPAVRGRGTAGRLLDALIAAARARPGLRRISLAVTVGNVSALRLYESRGFVVWGTDPEANAVAGRLYDEVRMSLALH